jgi:hypothetical protein
VDVSTGIDLNANGLLESDEVTRVVTICNGSDGANALADTTPFDTSEGCPSGGIRVNAGVDRNASNTLDDDEVLRTEELCNGSAGNNGLTTRIVLTTLEAGTTCAAGGARIESGIDLDGNGTLAAEEVQQQATVCNGEQGPAGSSCTVERDDLAGTTTVSCEDGTEAIVHDGDSGPQGPPGVPGDPGLRSLVRLEPELGGPNCPFSGTRILVGIDDNNDGVLQGPGAGQGEVDDESLVCGSQPGPCAQNFVKGAEGACVAFVCRSAGFFAADSVGQSASSLPTNFAANENFTVAFWALTQNPQGGTFFIKGTSAGNKGSGDWSIVYDSSTVNFAHQDCGLGSRCFASFPMTGNRWVHRVFVYSSGAVQFFQDGTLIETRTLSFSAPSGLPLLVGGLPGDNPSRSFMADIAIWRQPLTPVQVQQVFNRTLSPAEIPSLVSWWPMNEGAGFTAHDIAGGDNDLTLANSVTWSTSECPATAQ